MIMTIATQPRTRPNIALADDDHEQIVVRQDSATGLRMVVAVHSTVLGPALGGMRLKRYPGGLREALEDVMALARTMTLKASAAGLDLGGGKAVVIDDGDTGSRAARLEAAARVVDGLDGAYITAEDIGTTTADMDFMSRFLSAVGRSRENGGGGDPSPVTAETVFEALPRGARGGHRLGRARGPPGRRDRARQGRRRLADASAPPVAGLSATTSTGSEASARVEHSGRSRCPPTRSWPRARRARAVRRRGKIDEPWLTRSTAASWPAPPTARSPPPVARTC